MSTIDDVPSRDGIHQVKLPVAAPSALRSATPHG
jgi:hypothetical protein